LYKYVVEHHSIFLSGTVRGKPAKRGEAPGRFSSNNRRLILKIHLFRIRITSVYIRPATTRIGDVSVFF